MTGRPGNYSRSIEGNKGRDFRELSELSNIVLEIDNRRTELVDIRAKIEREKVVLR